jgi:CubicO group peptidase (beta-lactamase class C family)
MAPVAPHLNALPPPPDARSCAADEALHRLRDWLGALHSQGLFNGTVLIARDGAVCFEQHYGFADLDRRVALSAESSFSLASVSKPFTALGILMLAHAGRLALDDRLAQHVPEFSTYGTVTLRHLLHHTSGIPDYVELADDYWDDSKLLTMPDMIALFVQHRPRAYFVPGANFEYSNTGYALLGEVIARTSGQSYPEFLAGAVFRPLGMNDTAAFNLTSKECPLRCRVWGLRRSFGRLVLSDLNFLDGIFGDGGIYASAQDLNRWDAGLRAGTLLPCEFYEQAYVSGRLNDGSATGYGFGWELGSANVVEHWGEWEGFAAHVRRDLRQNVLTVALSNLGPAEVVDPICKEFAAFVGRIDWSAAGATA